MATACSRRCGFHTVRLFVSSMMPLGVARQSFSVVTSSVTFGTASVMVQEWQYEEKDRQQHSIDEFGRIRMLSEEPVENLVTWVYEEGSYVPVAKIQNGERYTIISDYIGRPVEAYNSYGNVVWQADYDVYGDLRNIKGIRDFIPFRQLGQYEDDETRLYYNRFRYYDPRIGNYISQDPIRLVGGNPTLYGYVIDPNIQ